MLGQHRHVYIWPPSWQNLRSATFFRAFGYAKLNTLRIGATNENGVGLRLANHSVTCTYDVHRLVLQSDIPFGPLGAAARKNRCRDQGFSNSGTDLSDSSTGFQKVVFSVALWLPGRPGTS